MCLFYKWNKILNWSQERQSFRLTKSSTVHIRIFVDMYQNISINHQMQARYHVSHIIVNPYYVCKIMRTVHNKTTQYKHRNLNHAHWKVCQGSWIFWTNLGLFWNEQKTWFCIETRWVSGVLLFGVHLELKFEAEIKGWNPKMIQLKKTILVSLMKNQTFLPFLK